MPSAEPSPELIELTVAGNFAEVWLAKEGHTGLVGISFLHKVQLPLLPATDAPRERVCDLGCLRTPYRKADGSLGYRCPGEPEHLFVAKGGAPKLTVGRKCLSNGLVAAVQLAQHRADGSDAPPSSPPVWMR